MYYYNSKHVINNISLSIYLKNNAVILNIQ